MVAGLTDYSIFASADYTIQEVVVPAALSALLKVRNLRLRLNSQPIYFRNSALIFFIESLLVSLVLALVLATGGERDFE